MLLLGGGRDVRSPNALPTDSSQSTLKQSWNPPGLVSQIDREGNSHHQNLFQEVINSNLEFVPYRADVVPPRQHYHQQGDTTESAIYRLCSFEMVHPDQQQLSSSNTQNCVEQLNSANSMTPERSQILQINCSSQAADSLPGTSMDSSFLGSPIPSVPQNSWVQSPSEGLSLAFDSRLITEDSFYSTLAPDLNNGGFSNDDILEYLPSLEDSKKSSDPSDSQGLLWELETEEDRSNIKQSDGKYWAHQSSMEFDQQISPTFKGVGIKSESVTEPTLAELNANEDSSVLDGFDVNSFLMDSMDKKDVFAQVDQQLQAIQDIKVEPTLNPPTAVDNWSGANFVDAVQQGSLPATLSQSSSLQVMRSGSSTLSAVGGPQTKAVDDGVEANSSCISPVTFLNPLPPAVYSSLSSSLPSTSSAHPLKQHAGGGKVTSRSFLHTGSPSSSPARKSLLVSGKPKCGGSSFLADRLSSSAPSTNTMEQMFKARKAEVLKTGRLRHGSTDTTLSQLSSFQLTMEDGFSSQADDEDDSDIEERSSGEESGSDNEYDRNIRSPTSPTSMSLDDSVGTKKKGKYFWQYNVQAKGPKGPRMKVTNVPNDPHVFADVTDPVFSPDCQLEGVKHAGKARRGDGNDLTPNPNKLHSIGNELKKLNRIINDLTPQTDLPFNARNKSRKEKNKLASRACRLKKKAQHEANKLKLYGLQLEHKRLLDAATNLRRLCAEKSAGTTPTEEHKQRLESLISEADSLRVAGNTSDYVNKILANIANGAPRGGLEI